MAASIRTSTARDAEPAAAATNLVVLHGVVRREPELRTLPSGDQVLQLEVRAERTEGPADTVPVELLQPPAAALRLAVGSSVIVVGRVQRRFFRTGGAVASRTFVAASSVLSARQRRRVERVMKEVVARLETLLD